MLKLAEYPILTAAYTKISLRVKKRNVIGFLFPWKRPCDIQSSVQRVVSEGNGKRLCGKSPMATSRSRCRDWMNAELSISIRQAEKQENEHDVLSVCLWKQEQSKHWVKMCNIYENNCFLSMSQQFFLQYPTIVTSAFSLNPINLSLWSQNTIRVFSEKWVCTKNLCFGFEKIESSIQMWYMLCVRDTYTELNKQEYLRKKKRKVRGEEMSKREGGRKREK